MAGFPKITLGSLGLNAGETIHCLDLLSAEGCFNLDTALLYDDGKDQQKLGVIGAHARGFTISTKSPAGARGPGTATRDQIVADAADCRTALGHSVDIFYLHGFDPATPLEETLAGINAVFETGFFKRFGLTNFPPAAVEEAVQICEAHGYPRPSVYQAQYSAAARRCESELFPTLRRLGLTIDAHSPIAGGLLAMSKAQILEGQGRWDPKSPVGGLYHRLYNKPEYLDALELWASIAEGEKTSGAELGFRWLRYHSQLKEGDSIVFGAASVKDCQENVRSLLSGPLSPKAVEQVDQFWKRVAGVAPLEFFDAFK